MAVSKRPKGTDPDEMEEIFEQHREQMDDILTEHREQMASLHRKLTISTIAVSILTAMVTTYLLI